MADVVRCLGCGARFKVADAEKVVRAKVQCKKCGGALAADASQPVAASVGTRDEDYDFKPSRAPAARAGTTAAAAADGRPAIVVSNVIAGPTKRVYTDADLATDEDTDTWFGRNKKLIIALTSAIVPLVLAVIIAVTFTGTGRKKRSVASKSGGAAAVAAAAAANTPRGPSTPPPPPVVTPPQGIWPLPAGQGAKAKGKFLDGPVQLVRTDLPPRGMLFTGRDVGQAVIVSSPRSDNGCWLDRYDLTSGKQVGTVEMPTNTIDRGRVADLSPDGNWLLTAKGRHLDVWSIEGEKGVRAADVEIVGPGEETPLWSGLAAADIVLVMFETPAGDKLMAYTPRPTSAPPVDLGTAKGEEERKRDQRWSRDTVQMFTPRFTPDRRLIAFWADGAVQFADPATGKVVSTLPSQSNRVGSGIAFDESCTRAAVVWRDLKVGFLSVYDLKTGQTVADFPLNEADAAVAPRRWLGPDHVLLDDGSLVDVKRGAPVWRYQYASRLIQAVPHPDERFWYMVDKPKGETSLLAVAALPRPAETAGAAGAASAFASTKGLPVAVQLELTGPTDTPDAYRRRIQGKIEARLKQFGVAPTANAPTKLKVTAKFIDTGEYAEARNAVGAAAEKVPLRTLTGAIVLDDGVGGSKAVRIKDFSIDTPAHDNMPLKPGKPATNILQDMQWDTLEGQIDDFVVPAYLSRNPKAVNSSKLEP